MRTVNGRLDGGGKKVGWWREEGETIVLGLRAGKSDGGRGRVTGEGDILVAMQIQAGQESG